MSATILPLNNAQTARESRNSRFSRISLKNILLLVFSTNFLIILFLFSDVSSHPTNRSSAISIADARRAVRKESNISINEKQEAVMEAFLHAWNGYKKFAWGHDELRPVTKTYEDPFELGLTIIDSLDTAIIMGLKNETQDSIDWIRHNLHFDKDKTVNLFETTIRILGGLLSAYHLTKENILITKAEELAVRLLPALIKSKNFIPFSDINLSTGEAVSPNKGLSSLSEATTLQLEFRDLSRITKNEIYENAAFATSKHIHEVHKNVYEGILPYFISQTGELEETVRTLGARADSYYEYLLKQWLQTGKTIDWLIEDYTMSIQSIKHVLLKKTSPNGFYILGEMDEVFVPKMDHLACFLSGSLALSSYHNIRKNDYLEMAQQLATICHEMYQNPTGLGPEIIYGNLKKENQTNKSDIYIKAADSHSLLRPEAIESWFYLYRITGDKKYQQWGWDAFEAIEKYARVDSGGYSSIQSVFDSVTIRRIDKMESFFLSETLKYLYLLLSDDQSMFPLDEWVFNTEAHPLPIYQS